MEYNKISEKYGELHHHEYDVKVAKISEEHDRLHAELEKEKKKQLQSKLRKRERVKYIDDKLL